MKSFQQFFGKNSNKITAYRNFIYFTLPILFFTTILISYRHYIIMWDSGAYFDHCISPAVSRPFSLLAFNCENHGSIVYGLLFSALQYINLGNALYIHITSLILMITGFLFFTLLLKTLFKNPLWVFIGLASICWNPAILANAINPTPDLTVLTFSMMCLWGFLEHRLVCAAFFGLALIFSKEIGLIYYALCCLFYFICFYQTNKKWKLYVTHVITLIWPFFIYGSFILYKTHIIGQKLFFQNNNMVNLIHQFLGAPDLHFYAGLSLIFILNFQWIVILAIIIKTFITLLDNITQNTHRKKFKEIRSIYYIGLITISLIYILCQYHTFLNVRYYIAIFPLTTLLLIYMLQSFPRWIGVPIGITYLLALLVSCFWTVDPVSKQFYGTFYFGRHELLKITSLNHECCGYGRDQLVYNLEYTHFLSLLNKFSHITRLKKTDLIFTHPLADHHILGNLSNENGEWTLQSENSFKLVQSNDPTKLTALFTDNKISRIFYLEFPNIEDKAFQLQLMASAEIVSTFKIIDQGYLISAFELKKPTKTIESQR